MTTFAAPAPTAPPSVPREIVVPEGFNLHVENTSHILLSADNSSFLNPAQEFNRDLSVAVIRTWSEIYSEEKKTRWEKKRARERRRAEERAKGLNANGNGTGKKRKVEEEFEGEEDGEGEDERPSKRRRTEEEAFEEGEDDSAQFEDATHNAGALPGKPTARTYVPFKFTILEAFSATGLRSIRYAKEIPLLKYVVANDISPAAVAAVRKNMELNELSEGGKVIEEEQAAAGATDGPNANFRPKLSQGPIRISQADARAVMYSHTDIPKRFDAIDLDPYGTAAPFIDAAVQAVADGGLLCVTCTDMGVLASTNYMEKCFANYGGVPVKAEYCHEVALRLVLHTLSTSAARYGRLIVPILSLSIDFYVRIFVRVQSSPIEVKQAASKTAVCYVCSGCQSPHLQPLGRMITKGHPEEVEVDISLGGEREAKQGKPSGKGKEALLFKTHWGPPVKGADCDECGHRLQVAGPMWCGPLHDKAFVEKVLEHVNSLESAEVGKYGTWARMKGMLTVASEELDAPFYFTPSTVAGLFHTICPSLIDTASAILNAGHAASRSHCAPGSIKTTATRAQLYDIFRSWIKKHPVNMEKVKENSPTAKLLAKEMKKDTDWSQHPESFTKFRGIQLVRYTAQKWAPGTKAKGG